MNGVTMSKSRQATLYKIYIYIYVVYVNGVVRQ